MGRGGGSYGHEPQSGQRPITPAVGVPMMRQRGFYTELLDAEMDPAQVSAIAQDASRGSVDPMLQPQLAAPVQKVPPATQFEADVNDALQAASDRRAKLGAGRSRPGTAQRPGYGSAPSRALEPKVLVPYNVGPGKTPRKIAIERQKRLFALQVIPCRRESRHGSIHDYASAAHTLGSSRSEQSSCVGRRRRAAAQYAERAQPSHRRTWQRCCSTSGSTAASRRRRTTRCLWNSSMTRSTRCGRCMQLGVRGVAACAAACTAACAVACTFTCAVTTRGDVRGDVCGDMCGSMRLQVRPLDEWISLSEESDDGTRFLPALFLNRDRKSRKAAWYECQVQSYDHESRRFEVHYYKEPGDTESTSAEVHAPIRMEPPV